jgi:hypothetical protein
MDAQIGEAQAGGALATCRNRIVEAVYVALALNPDGEKSCLGFGSNKPRAPNSGSRWSMSSKPAASTTS